MARTARRLGAVVAALVCVVALLVVLAVIIIKSIPNHQPLPGEQRCVATAADQSVAVDTEQAHYAALIAGISVRKGLAPRAASIALATAYQESNLRNLDHGDRDSVGLFQQRPSMGWGTEKQLMNPYYATTRFYRALIKIHGWEKGDITEIAQKIQISGYPDAYRDHEADARVLASVLTGQSPAGIRCLIRDQRPGDVSGLIKDLRKTYQLKPKHSGSVITISAGSTTLAWSYAQFAVANARQYGVARVEVGSHSYQVDNRILAEWKTTQDSIGAKSVKITTRAS
ncbi:hypothetical protein FOE78_19725 [Microlunatus elymi]|uniref:Uncharacterized protein n=1 Tax=Microlunatus elymi TaxID=2596828 RepID=A0A516Q355_9ACTN|nr:hypothetical protein [Microlunatus elymi]QDP97838.1 hypothetical protein FOE78_19725 [Microlunatus elymi]